jgi:PAS domain S-box-containing protein
LKNKKINKNKQKKGKKAPDKGLAINSRQKPSSNTVVDRKTLKSIQKTKSITRNNKLGYKLLLETIRDYAIFMLNKEGYIITWNKGAERINGYTSDEIIGQHLSCFYEEEERWLAKPEALLKAAGKRGSIEDEGWRIRKDGSKYWASVLLTAMYDKHKKLKGFIKITRDITEKRESELALQRAYEIMEERVKERTAQLQGINEELKEEIDERKKIEAKLENTIREKELLLKEVHHRVKNNLQIISSLLKLQTNYTEDQNAKEILNDSQSRVKTMALIHEKLYQTDDLNKVDFKEYANDLITKLFSSYSYKAKNVNSLVEIANVCLSIDNVVTLGLILNELISNIFKHAFHDGSGSKIKIGLIQAGNNLKLSVSDNGKGFPSSVDFKNSNSLGLQLVNTLVEQIKGRIELTNKNGTTFLITFPYSAN